MVKTQRFSTVRQVPRRIYLDEGFLIVPPTSLRDLPPDGVVGSFMGLPAVRFITARGLAAVFLHDLCSIDLNHVMDAQRHQAEAQLGADYARRVQWWEAK
jgi:hypothetical protein